MNYRSIEQALDMDAPEVLDYVSFDYKGIKFRAYGFLHGINGGPNKFYKDVVKHTIEQAPGLILGEHGLERESIGLNIEYSLHDYLPHSFWQSMKMGFLLSVTSPVLWNIIKTTIKEKLYKRNPMQAHRLHGIVDLCNSPNFHLIEPHSRRKIAGFPTPNEYLKLNIRRKYNHDKTKGPYFPVREWDWLTKIEPLANIPLRSIHMLEYAVSLAHFLKQDEVSLFVGEVHQTDMLWLANGGRRELDEREQAICQTVEDKAYNYARKYSSTMTSERLKFCTATIVGGCVPNSIAIGCLIEIILKLFS